MTGNGNHVTAFNFKIRPKIRFKKIRENEGSYFCLLQFDNKIWSVWWPEMEIMWLLSISKSGQKLDSKKFVKMRDHTYVYNSLTKKYEGYDDRKRKSCDCWNLFGKIRQIDWCCKLITGIWREKAIIFSKSCNRKRKFIFGGVLAIWNHCAPRAGSSCLGWMAGWHKGGSRNY